MAFLNYTNDIEMLRLAFVVGIAVSLVFYERWNLTTGSVVVPGYLAASLPHPASIVTTLVLAFACHVVVNRVVAKRVLIYGRAKFALLALTSVALNILLNLAWTPTELSGQWGGFAESIGYVIPALIAHDMGRQGIRRTSKTVALSSAVVVIFLVAAATVVATPSAATPAVTSVLAYPSNALPFAVLISAATAWFLQGFLNLRSGGFVGGAYVALVSSDPRAIVGLLVLALLTYFLVSKVMSKAAILFGRRKFSAMLLTGATLGWWAVSAGPRSGLSPVLDFGSLAGFAVVPLFLPALIANDMERVGARRTFAGVGVSTLLVLGSLRVLDEARGMTWQVGVAIASVLIVVHQTTNLRRTFSSQDVLPAANVANAGGTIRAQADSVLVT